MARRNLAAAAAAAVKYPDRARELGVDSEESAAWRDIAAAMFIPYDEALQVHPQAVGFTGHQVWDFAGTPADHYPLLLHYPYFDLYRKQVVKQADLVLAMHLCGEAFTAEQKERNFAYYEALTVRDSSLSASTQAVIAAEVGNLDLAFDYLGEAALMDLEDLEHNTRDGLHIASLAGTWLALIAGFAGLRLGDGAVAFAPRLPEGISRLAFTILIRAQRLRVEVTHSAARYLLADGGPLDITHYGSRLHLAAGKPREHHIPGRPAVARPSQPAGRAPRQRLVSEHSD
jgi:alpha,alpha-trehalose phosphorylase